jgi:type II secretory pathway pseudopilin PulG
MLLQTKTHFMKDHARGFTLIVTLSLMILLTVLAVGLLSLSSVSLRASSQSDAMSIARSNARTSMMLAIGELQKQTGPDTRVTARADVLDENNSPVLGVWKSWEGTNHETTGAFAGRPISPGDYTAKKKARFLAWLVSGDSAVLPNTAPGADKITLVGPGSVGAGPDRENLQIHLTPSEITVGARRGSFAWWIGGENQKARVPKPYGPAGDTVAGWSAQSKSHAVADTKPFRLEKLLGDVAAAAKVVSLHQADLVADKGALPASNEFFHDLSATSSGLLTNTATGGWRKDLSLATENWDKLPATGLPFFRIDANGTTSVSKPTPAAPQAPQSLFYPWSAYWGDTNNAPIYQHGAVSSWHNLKHYATAYKRTIAYPTYNIVDKNNAFPYLHEIRTGMVVARVHWLFSHRTVQQENHPDPAMRNTYNLEFLITPVITMWNPYNVALTSPANLRIQMGKPMPCAFRHYNKDGIPLPEYRRLTWGAFNPPEIPGNHPVMPPGANAFNYLIPSAFTLAPGETRVYSPVGITGIGDGNLNLSPGYRPGTGHLVNISSYLGHLDATDPVKVDVVFNAGFIEAAGAPVHSGIWLDMFLGTDQNVLHYIQVNRMQYLRDVANKYWTPIPATELASPTAQEIKGIWQPFLSAVYGTRISGPSSTGLPGKGLLQTSPMVSYMRMQENYVAAQGGAHPVNAASDLSFFKHTANDSKLPNANNTNNRGFIISGFSSADGLSRIVMSEIPLQPLVSLAELQNWDMRSQNGVPPFQLNVIANSDASPLLPTDKVMNTGGGGNFQYDDSYCANHLLFDDWFFSSIAPKTAKLGVPTASETLKKTYTDFVSRIDPLPNRAYQPIAADAAAAQTTGGADKLFLDHADKADSWQTIASRLEVEGMFNVNSTSVKAWRALLGHARNQKIPHHTEAGMSLSGETNYGHSRFSVAGDVKAGGPGMSGGFSLSSELTGYRIFDDALLDTLADEIVKQVRLRGPFLSLSEFVSRQLSSNQTLALAGAIQTALNEMSSNAGANDPYAKLKSDDLSQEAGDPNDPKLRGAGYVFPEAAIGRSTYGLPGWIRQADVLRPLAPILSARDDTFTIRAYGDARDASGNITASATCEATVRRTRDYVDPTDAAEINTLPTSTTNQTFGRRYQIISFRWLTNSEI